MPNRFAKKLDEIRTYMEKNSKFGASDTEPRVILTETLDEIFTGDYKKEEIPGLLPSTAEEWQLYSDMEGNEDVAKRLRDLLLELLELEVTVGEVAETFRNREWTFKANYWSL